MVEEVALQVHQAWLMERIIIQRVQVLLEK